MLPSPSGAKHKCPKPPTRQGSMPLTARKQQQHKAAWLWGTPAGRLTVGRPAVQRGGKKKGFTVSTGLPTLGEPSRTNCELIISLKPTTISYIAADGKKLTDSESKNKEKIHGK